MLSMDTTKLLLSYCRKPKSNAIGQIVNELKIIAVFMETYVSPVISNQSVKFYRLNRMINCKIVNSAPSWRIVRFDKKDAFVLSSNTTSGRISHIMRPNKFSTILLNSQKSIAFKRLLVAHSFNMFVCGFVY
uniref:Uncharacterized protein n=1 Tax=Glossina palpalis gambiensis TaxID=67801 RepID=A0A1B0BXQ6_9MUSC